MVEEAMIRIFKGRVGVASVGEIMLELVVYFPTIFIILLIHMVGTKCYGTRDGIGGVGI